MADIRMGPAETQFAEIIWEHEPIASGELSKIAEEKLNWKKTTSFTVIKWHYSESEGNRDFSDLQRRILRPSQRTVCAGYLWRLFAGLHGCLQYP